MEQGSRGIYPKSFSWDCFLFPRVAEEGFLLPSGRRVSLRSPRLCPPGRSRAPNAPTGFGGQSRSFLLFVPQLLVWLSFPQGESLIKNLLFWIQTLWSQVQQKVERATGCRRLLPNAWAVPASAAAPGFVVRPRERDAHLSGRAFGRRVLELKRLVKQTCLNDFFSP